MESPEEEEEEEVTLTPHIVVPTLTAVKTYPCWRPGMDMPGHEVNQVRLHHSLPFEHCVQPRFQSMDVNSADHCQVLCRGQEGCGFWVWVRHNANASRSACYMKDKQAICAKKYQHEVPMVAGPKECEEG